MVRKLFLINKRLNIDIYNWTTSLYYYMIFNEFDNIGGNNMRNTLDKIEASGKNFENYAKSSPDFLAAFNQLAEAAFKDSPIDIKTAEMIFVSIAIARQCEGCLLAHVPKALEAGVTREEILSVINISVLMGGGPASSYGAMALSIYDDIAALKK